MEATQTNIWEENDLTEPERSCLNSNDNEQNVITNDTKNGSIKNQCEDIGKRERRKLQISTANRKWYLKNKERRSTYNKTHCKQWRLKNREHIQHFRRQYCLKNEDKLKEYHTKYCYNRRKTDMSFKISCYLRARMYRAIKNGQKAGSAVRDLGCSIEQFKQYISNGFQPKMSWNNYGEWHLDHIMPLSSFNLQDREQFLKACHYTNYQPLWKTDNIRKSNKLLNPHLHRHT